MSDLTEEKRKQYQDTKERWKSRNTYHFSIRLQNSTDADIIKQIEKAPSKQGELKRLVRLGMKYEQEHLDKES